MRQIIFLEQKLNKVSIAYVSHSNISLQFLVFKIYRMCYVFW